MILRCSSCNGQLEITGFEGSAVHTSCPNCNKHARPKSLKPIPIQLVGKQRVIHKIRSVPVMNRRALSFG